MTEIKMSAKYDPLVGRPMKEIRASDIVHVSAKYAQYSAGSIAMTTLDAKTELFITHFGVSSTLAGGNSFYITVGNSTLLPIILATAGNAHVRGSRDSPLAKAAANSTISVWVGAAGTVGAWMSGVREPAFAYVETA